MNSIHASPELVFQVSKVEAAQNLKKLIQKEEKRGKRARMRRNLLDIPVPSEMAENLLSTLKVRGKGAWAKIGPGTVKLVKRIQPSFAKPAL